MIVSSPVVVALDFAEAGAALALADALDPADCRVKVGKELFTRAGPSLVTELTARGFDVFLDLKFHDIPNTVAGAVRAAAELGCWMVNVHASGGPAMLAAAAEAVVDLADRPLLIGVTVLTSLDDAALRAIGVAASPEEQVLRLAALTRDAGLDGVVCSAREAAALRQRFGPDFRLVTPGIRPSGADKADQKRVVTPADAVGAGADYLVIGRPITAAPDPAAALAAINLEVAG
ncbi:MAG: orotidine-5'-phosphate decarboxylase [Gammaproteobacteria bacterium]|nr:orotidine-5'-phosphate decarboxylase [Gammaproteobacteria bacterium]NNM01472.1 orotidine-5'-phosphate decarboxylase [Gammaproteobacteria bacterium]